jgi:hypothetical protein
MLPHVIVDLIDSYCINEPFDLIHESKTSSAIIHIIDNHVYYNVHKNGFRYYNNVLNPCSEHLKYSQYVNVISFVHNIVVHSFNNAYDDDYLKYGEHGYSLFINNKQIQSLLPKNLQQSQIISFRLYKDVLYFGTHNSGNKMNVYMFDLQTQQCTYLTMLPTELLFVSDKHICVKTTNTLYRYNINNKDIIHINLNGNIRCMSDQYVVYVNYKCKKNCVEIRSIDQPDDVFTLDIPENVFFNNDMFYFVSKNNGEYIVSVYKLY